MLCAVIKVPLQQRKRNVVYEYSEAAFIDENGLFYEGMGVSNLTIDSEGEAEGEGDEEKVDATGVSSRLKAQLKDVVFDCVENGMVNFNYVCSKWRYPGHLWVELHPHDVLVEFGCSNRPFATNQYFCLASSAGIMSESDDVDDCEWQCSNLLHRVAWRRAIDCRVDDFNMFMNYAYGHGDRHVLEIVKNNDVDVDNAYYIDSTLALSRSFYESLGVRKECYDQWRFIWGDYKTNPFLRGVVVDEGVDSDVELPTASSRGKEVNDELKALSEVGHAWGNVWAFALNQTLVGATNCAAMTDTLMRCGAKDNLKQTMKATGFMQNSLWLSNKNFNTRESLGQSQYAASVRNAEFINKLEHGENGVIALNSAVNEMLPEEHERRRRMSFSYQNRLICASEMMVNPRAKISSISPQCAKIWDVKFSDIIKPSKIDKERAVFQLVFMLTDIQI